MVSSFRTRCRGAVDGALPGDPGPPQQVPGGRSQPIPLESPSDSLPFCGPAYQRVLDQLLQGLDPETTTQWVEVLARDTWNARQGAMGLPRGTPRGDRASPVVVHRAPTGDSHPPLSLDSSTQQRELVRWTDTPSPVLDAELHELEQTIPEAVGIWTAKVPAVAPPSDHSQSSTPSNVMVQSHSFHSQSIPAVTVAVAADAQVLSNPVSSNPVSSNPFDVPELLGQILIDVPRKVAQPVIWKRQPRPVPNGGPVAHHHRHVQMVSPGVNRSQAVRLSDEASQDKEFYNSDSAVFPRSVVPAIVKTTSPAQAQWDEQVKKVGVYFRQQRHHQGMSLATLSHRTYIPLHHLVSLETGTMEQLPQPIYVKGFIQHIAKDLGLDGEALIKTLPPLPMAEVAPSWMTPKDPEPMSLSLRSWHLYVGYSAVLAGSMAWVAQDLQPMPATMPTSAQPSQENLAPAVQGDGLDGDQDLSSLAPPEAIQL